MPACPRWGSVVNMDTRVDKLHHLISSTGEEWADEFVDAQMEFDNWAKENSEVPPEIVQKANDLLRTKAIEIFNDAYEHCRTRLHKEISPDQAGKLVILMNSKLGKLLEKVLDIRDQAYQPFFNYFQSIIPDVIGSIAEEWFKEDREE